MLVCQKTLNVIDQCNIITDKKDIYVGVILLQYCCPMNKNQCLAATRWAGYDPVPADVLPGDALLVVIQSLQQFVILVAGPFHATIGQFDPDNGKEQLFKMV